MAEDVFEKWRYEEKPTRDISEIADYSRAVQNELIREGKPWSYEDLQKALEKKFGSHELALAGTVKIVKGEKLVIGITSEQFDAIEAIYGIHSYTAIMSTVNATVSSGENVEKAKVTWLSAHRPTDQIIISDGLARKLKVSEEDEIKILKIEEDVENLNLDEI